eukprot:TRINITY_DN10125_c0_g1_i1.p3 TRINITY_DN10125_c0_g1~~TRINITY_DN10125_c0_g1_i1.p3  ORF type:complete len:103 (+),score=24.52 TRINITY_DN10125_c0_g1_i1:64-372(+)
MCIRDSIITNWELNRIWIFYLSSSVNRELRMVSRSPDSKVFNLEIPVLFSDPSRIHEFSIHFTLGEQNMLHFFRHDDLYNTCLLYTSPSPRDLSTSRMPSSA